MMAECCALVVCRWRVPFAVVLKATVGAVKVCLL